MQDNETFDVVVVGSGSAGAMAALRAADHGLKVLIIEKAQKFGGTSATSGGVLESGLWAPVQARRTAPSRAASVPVAKRRAKRRPRASMMASGMRVTIGAAAARPRRGCVTGPTGTDLVCG